MTLNFFCDDETDGEFCKEFINSLIEKLEEHHPKIENVIGVRFISRKDSEKDVLMEVNAQCIDGNYYRITASGKPYFNSVRMGG